MTNAPLHVLAGFATACLLLTVNIHLFFRNGIELSTSVPSPRQEEVDGLFAQMHQLGHARDYARSLASLVATARSSVSAETIATPTTVTVEELVDSLYLAEDLACAYAT